MLEQKRELAGVREENQRLRKQVAINKTNAPTGALIPPDFIRASKAQWVGLSRPEDTMQSFLWAVESRNITNMLRVLTPEAGEKFLKQFGESPEKFFDDASKVPGFRITNHKRMPDGSVDVQIEFAPGIAFPGTSMRLREINGEWRMTEVP
ncbi:MAG TPA: hypothetical protein VFM25_08240 [Verrucomicrobiae bacterium]|nr:hypothetical protein [Verrucomicrobiae bacterium]